MLKSKDRNATRRMYYFIEGLKLGIKQYVILQQPTSLEDAEMHAKLKESTPEPQPIDCTDEILKAVAQLKTSDNMTQPTVEAYNMPYTNKSLRIRNRIS